ncbi:unnamed protein product [Blepharisma stoltei]|uniref:Kinetochore protein NDC80 n=1 Tax=Blepharisma stoltei TaxID=1481888 RepID=A0AAU9JIK4_9CILI|nr:unnamed protein product [Blepharisma stoltei]
MEKRSVPLRSQKTRSENQSRSKTPDSRPLKEKEYQLACGRNIVEHLAINFYKYPVSLQTLLIPDIKSFWNISDFIFKKIDPSISCTNDKELIEILKWLGYPYAITGQMLNVAQNFWPNLLAVLSWLVDHIKNTFTDEIKTDLNKSDQTIFNEYLYEAYEYQLQDRPRLELHKSLLEKFKAKADAINNQKSEIQHKIDELVREKMSLEENDLTLLDFEIEELEVESKELIKDKDNKERLKNEYIYTIQSCWNILLNYFNVKSINETLVSSLKQKINSYQTRYIPLLEEQMYYESEIMEKSQELENTSLLIEKEKKSAQELDVKIQEELEKYKQTNGSLKSEVSTVKLEIDSEKENIANFENQSKTEISKVTAVIRADTEAICKHAQRIAGWLQELTMNL